MENGEWNEQDWADRFSRDVDNLLNEAGQMDSEPTPTEYRQALDLAHTLVTTDFSTESQVRRPLRRRLLNRTDAREGWGRRKKRLGHNLFWRRHPAVTLAAVVMAALLVVASAWPGVLTAAAQAVQDFVHILSVGEHTTIYHVDPDSAASRPQWTPSVRPRVELRWTIRTPIGNFSNNAGFGQDATVHYFNTLDEAQAITPFSLRQPAYLPVGYTFLDVMVPPPPSKRAFLFYGGPDGEIVLVQIPVYTRVEVIDETTMTGEIVSLGLMTGEPLEEVALNGRRAAWIEGRALVWEVEGISYLLGGDNLSLDEAIRIAESLE
ncbi:MAG: DUF4367 domain-containing protein [Chloroflexota bacterium]|nr:DUF4367 domain-containing protein [Chloroflexota bacterium]